jgi:hypothetical protein
MPVSVTRSAAVGGETNAEADHRSVGTTYTTNEIADEEEEESQEESENDCDEEKNAHILSLEEDYT